MRRSRILIFVMVAAISMLGLRSSYAQNIIDLLLQGIAQEAGRNGQPGGRTINLPREYNNKQYMKRVQQALLAIGIDAGEPDGVFGSRTLSAIRTFQSRYGFHNNGVLDSTQLNRLYALAGARRQENSFATSKSASYRVTADSLGGSGPRKIAIQCQSGSTHVLFQMDKRRWRSDTGAPDRDFHETAVNSCSS